MVIERLESLEKGKRKVWMDDGTSFAIYRSEGKGLELKEGAELSSEEYQKIVEKILIPRARRRAMHLLERMDRTEAQLREKLQMGGYPREAVEEAVAFMKGYHYIDDLRYACSYVRCRQENKSRRQLSMELYQKGISKDMVQQALEEEYGEEDETPKILKWMEKKRYDAGQADRKQKQRMYQFLMRKGFSSGDILRVL